MLSSLPRVFYSPPLRHAPAHGSLLGEAQAVREQRGRRVPLSRSAVHGLNNDNVVRFLESSSRDLVGDVGAAVEINLEWCSSSPNGMLSDSE